MQLNNNLQAEKRSAREQAIIAATNSPNLDEMEVFYLDEERKTALYFKKGTSDTVIKERLSKHFRKLNSIDNKPTPEDKIYTRLSRDKVSHLTDEYYRKEEIRNDY